MALTPGTYNKITGYAQQTRLLGIEKVTSNLESVFRTLKVGSRLSMERMMILLRGAMDKEAPKIPVDLGKLRASWFTKFVNVGAVHGVIFGFSANYALYVHEMVGADFVTPRWRYGPGPGKKRWYVPRPGAGPKFMETHMKRLEPKFYDILLTEFRERIRNQTRL